MRQKHGQNSSPTAWCCTPHFSKHDLNCSLTIITLILKKPVIVHYFMVTRKKRIYYKTSLFGKFYLFPQNIVSLQNKIIWTSRTKNKGPFYFRLNAKLIFAINNIWELIVGNAFVRSSPQWSWLKYSVIAPEYIILTWSLVCALLMINTVFDIIVCWSQSICINISTYSRGWELGSSRTWRLATLGKLLLQQRFKKFDNLKHATLFCCVNWPFFSQHFPWLVRLLSRTPLQVF